MFARAVELDPRYARAYAGMADCDSRLNSRHGVAISADEILANHRQGTGDRSQSGGSPRGARHALMIGSRLAEAAAAFEQALALDPNCL